jgi:hypothetical protein
MQAGTAANQIRARPSCAAPCATAHATHDAVEQRSVASRPAWRKAVAWRRGDALPRRSGNTEHRSNAIWRRGGGGVQAAAAARHGATGEDFAGISNTVPAPSSGSATTRPRMAARAFGLRLQRCDPAGPSGISCMARRALLLAERNSASIDAACCHPLCHPHESAESGSRLLGNDNRVMSMRP